MKDQIIRCGKILVKINPDFAPQTSEDDGATWVDLEWGDPNITVDINLWPRNYWFTTRNSYPMKYDKNLDKWVNT